MRNFLTAAAILLLAASFLILSLVYGLNRKQPILWPTKH